MSFIVLLPHKHKSWNRIREILSKMKRVESIDESFKLLSHLYYNYHNETVQDNVMQTPFSGLKRFMLKCASEEEQSSFLKRSLPTISDLVLQAADYQPDPPLSVIKQQEGKTVKLSRKFVACLVAIGFLCLYDDMDDNDLSMPELNFTYFFNYQTKSNQAKLRMILTYFECLSCEIPAGEIIYQRLVLENKDKLNSDICARNEDLCALIVDSNYKIEDAGRNVLQVDFANEYLGGGVLNSGCVQEEIRFCICPELLSSMLFMESMAENEAIAIQGFQQFSSYEGYGESLRFAGKYDDSASKDVTGQFTTTIVAIDAIPYFGYGNIKQYYMQSIFRELNKAYVGFLQPYAMQHSQPHETTDPKWMFNLDPHKKRTIATGNWGCGAFGGDPELKSLLQWLAASIARCPAMIYYTFSDPQIDSLKEITKMVTSKCWTVGKLASEVINYCKELVEKEDEMDSTLFEYLNEKASL